MNKESKKMLVSFLASAEKELTGFAHSLSPETFSAAVDLILNAKRRGNRLHITGIGKPGHVASYIASLLSSTGSACYFLDGTEAVHGSCGQLAAGDVVICISNSGETAELKATAAAIRNNECSLVAVTGDPESWLAKFCDVTLPAGVSCEGGPLNRAPRNSVLAEILVLQALSVILQAECGWSPKQYVRCHPGGKLGALRENETENA